ncbi:hypothetical protein AAMO2058_001280000 [Amorphochlora amoebiformis]
MDAKGVSFVKVRYEGKRKSLAMIPGLDSKRTAALLKAVYRLGEEVVALHDPSTKQIIPIPVLVSKPDVFKSTYGIVLEREGPMDLGSTRERANGKHASVTKESVTSSAVTGGDVTRGSVTYGASAPPLYDLVDEKHEYSPRDRSHISTKSIQHQDCERVLNLQRKLQLHKLTREEMEGILKFSILNGKVDLVLLRTALLNFLPGLNGTKVSILQRIITEITDLFDVNCDGKLGIAELGAALSILWGGKEKEKVFLAFKALGLQSADGLISFKDLKAYLTAVFKAMLYFCGKSNVGNYSVETVAKAMAKQCFAHFALSERVGTITEEQFSAWYSGSISD